MPDGSAIVAPQAGPQGQPQNPWLLRRLQPEPFMKTALQRPRPSRPRRSLTPSRPRLAGLNVSRILVPVDFSDTSNKALPYAVALAEDMGAKITLLHVIEPVFVGTEPGLTYVPQEDVMAEAKPDREQLQKLAGRFIPKNLFDKALIREGTPYHEIINAAKSIKAGLIVITPHGRTGLSHILMGSTAEHVVRHASCPVLTVRRS